LERITFQVREEDSKQKFAGREKKPLVVYNKKKMSFLFGSNVGGVEERVREPKYVPLSPRRGEKGKKK
jgi:hypothetical protein